MYIHYTNNICFDASAYYLIGQRGGGGGDKGRTYTRYITCMSTKNRRHTRLSCVLECKGVA